MKSGQRFKKLTKKLAKKGAYDPKALAAYIGRKKYGKKAYGKIISKGERNRFHKK
jgi:hypothetical protein